MKFFSLLHTTARLPDGWKKAYDAWMLNADNPDELEYILCVDKGRETELPPTLPPNVQLVINDGRRCAVDGWNCAAAASTGRFLITVSDDWFPCPHWDSELLKAIPDLTKDYVVRVTTGGDKSLLTFSMLTRSYYLKYGYIFFPEYIGMCADNDFTYTAEKDGVIVDASHLTFPHYHPAYGTAEDDTTYAWQHRPEAWKTGYAVLEKRWPGVLKGLSEQRKLIAVCLPGETFSMTWVHFWMDLYSQMVTRGYTVLPFFCQSSNVAVSRGRLAEAVLDLSPRPDYVLWIDDDNLLTFPQFEVLVRDLELRDEISMVAGWCLINQDSDRVSCGSAANLPFHCPDIYRYKTDLIEVGYTGFPVVLMRTAALELAGKTPFAFLQSMSEKWGFVGEDVSFCMRLRQKGGHIYIDRRVLVPHLKLGIFVPPDPHKPLAPHSSRVVGASSPD